MVSIDSKLNHRKTSKTIRLTGRDGVPAGNMQVAIKQTTHKFLFGCAGFDAVQLANGEYSETERRNAEGLFDQFFELFNCVTLPFYWGRFEKEKGKPDTDRLKNAAKWLMAKGCQVKGHPLCWHTVTAPWLLSMDNAAILDAQLKRIDRDVTAFRGLIDLWDAINEVVIMPIFDKYDNGITRICKDLGRVRMVREVFEAAKKANPEAILLINDFNTSINYEILVDGCLQAGIPIDVIGLQSHMHQGYWGVEKTLEVLERFSYFKLPIHFTENTLVSGHIMPAEIEDLNDYQIPDWPSTPDGEERQAREIVMHYKTLFAHPLVESITWWNFTDNAWLGAPAGLIRRDNTRKPAYDELRKLIRDQWWTTPVKTATNESGELRFEGFLGQYCLSCGGRDYSFELNKDGKDITIVI